MKLLRKIRALFSHRTLDADMSEEMRLHLEQRTDENIAAGMSPDAARYAALRRFGGVEQVKEIARAQRRGLWLDHLGRDVRDAMRALRKAPLVSLVIVASLGVGIGANAVVFSWIRSVVFRPLPGVAHAADFELVEPRTDAGAYPGMSWAEYRDLASRLTSFHELLAFRMAPLNLGERGQEERVYSQFVSGNYFAALGMQPALGRFLRADEAAQPGGAPVVVVSHGFWRTHLAGAPDALGRTLRVNDRVLTVVGVAPEGFQGTVVGLNFDLWLPATLAPALLEGSRELEQREVRSYSAMGRLKPGVSRGQARGELDAAMRDLATEFPATNAGVRAELLPFWRAPRGAPQFLLGSLSILQGFMLLVLVVVCANAANLLLARATSRRREIGVRLALGARPRQILRLLLVESTLLGLLAAAVGVFLALWGTDAIRAVPMPGGFPLRFQTDLDGAGLVFALALGLLCAVVFGLAPALQSARTDSQLALRTATAGPVRSRLRTGLVATEVALALLVLVAAAMFMRNFMETRTSDPGFRPEGVLLAAYDLRDAGYDRTGATALVDHLLTSLRATPGVEAAAVASWVPLDLHAMPLAAVKLDGRDRADGGTDRALTYTVTPGYFAAMRIPLLEGRDFSPLSDATARPEAIVNEEFVRRFLNGVSPVGRKLGGKGAIEIVGVAKNALYETFGEPPKPMLYLSWRDRGGLSGQIHVRVRGDEAGFAPGLRRLVRDIAPAVSLYDVRTLNEHVDRNLVFRRIPARLFAVLGPLILLLAAIGISAVVANSVAQRTTEIGVRIALGASTRRVVTEIVRQSMSAVLLGAAPAWLLSLAILAHVRGGSGLNAGTLLGVPGLLLGVALVAAWLPARRAAKVDPMVALRAE